MIVLDTNIVIEYLRGNHHVTGTVNEYLDRKNASITYINAYELLKYKINNDVIYDFINNVDIIYPDKDSIARSSGIFINLRSRGKLINENDILIAGIALTGNNKFITMDHNFENIENKNIIII